MILFSLQNRTLEPILCTCSSLAHLSSLYPWPKYIRFTRPDNFCTLVYQPVLPHGLIRINIRIRLIIIIIYLMPFSSIKYSNTYSKIYIYHYLVTIDFILHHTSICIQYMFSWTIYLWIGILISSIIHEYMVTYIVGSIFI